MANETNFKFTEAVFIREDEEGVVPATPSAVKSAGMINFSLKDTQQTETNATLDNAGQASKKDRGKSSFDGSMEYKMGGDMMPVLATHVIGDPDTIAAATAPTWAAATSYTIYDSLDETLTSGSLVSHSNGTDMLVCIQGGTSDATEPDVAGVSYGAKVTDNDVIWIKVKNLTKYSGGLQPCMPSCTIEYRADSGCGQTPVDFKKQINGTYINAMELSKAAGGIIHKYSFPVTARKMDDSEQAGFTSVKGIAGYSEQDMTDFAFKYDDMKVLVDGVEPVDSTMFRLTITRNTAYEDGVAIDTKVSNTPLPVVDGEIKLKFTKEQYKKAFDNESSVIKVLLGNARGEAAHFTFNNVERDRTDPDFTTERFAEITVPLTADGNSTYNTVDYVVQSQIDYQ